MVCKRLCIIVDLIEKYSVGAFRINTYVKAPTSRLALDTVGCLTLNPLQKMIYSIEFDFEYYRDNKHSAPIVLPAN